MDQQQIWEQPGFDRSLDAIAVDIIVEHIQKVFAELDPRALVAETHPELTAEDAATVAEMIDLAVVELEVDFSRNQKLPRLDSNQEPTDSPSGVVIDLFTRKLVA